MPTTILDPMPPEVEALIRRRRELGQDLHDEVWKGNYHLVPGPHPRHGDVQRQLLVVLDEPTRQAGLLLLVTVSGRAACIVIATAPAPAGVSSRLASSSIQPPSTARTSVRTCSSGR